MNRILSLFAAAAVAAAAGSESAASTSAIAAAVRPSSATVAGPILRATNLMRGRRFTRFVETGSIGVPSSYDQRLHLCSSGRFIFDEVSNLPGVSRSSSRTIGRWRVVSASFTGRRAVARVRGLVTRGRSLDVVIASDGRRTTIDRRLVIVERSDLCR